MKGKEKRKLNRGSIRSLHFFLRIYDRGYNLSKLLPFFNYPHWSEGWMRHEPIYVSQSSAACNNFTSVNLIHINDITTATTAVTLDYKLTSLDCSQDSCRLGRACKLCCGRRDHEDFPADDVSSLSARGHDKTHKFIILILKLKTKRKLFNSVLFSSPLKSKPLKLYLPTDRP